MMNVNDTPLKLESGTNVSVPTKLEGDEAELARMGYKQELKRDLGLLQVIALSLPLQAAHL